MSHFFKLNDKPAFPTDSIKYFLDQYHTPQGFGQPFGIEFIVYGCDEYIFVTDLIENKLIKFDLNFTMIKSITVTKPRWLASSSNALFVNSNQRAIFKYDFDLNLLKSVNCTSFCGTHSCCELWGMYFNKETNELFIIE